MRHTNLLPRLLLGLAITAQAVFPMGQAPAAKAELINGELRFSPYAGSLSEFGETPSIAGRTVVSLNGIPVMNELLSPRPLSLGPVDGEPTALIWLLMHHNAQFLRRRDNLLELSFIPNDRQRPYRVWLRWNGVSDREQRSEEVLSDGRIRVTSSTIVDLQVTDRQLSGELSYTHRFDAPWVTEQPWQSLPPITSLSAADEQELRRLVQQRRALYDTDLGAAYASIPATAGLDVAVLRQNRCLELARDGGMTFGDADGSQVRLRPTGGPVVVAEGSSGELFPRAFPEGFGQQHSTEQDFCLLGALAGAFPRWMLFIRNGEGRWQTLN